MKNDDETPDASEARKRIEQAETRAQRAETRTEQAKTRTEQAETRTEQAETRTEQAKSRAEQAETRAEQAETTLQIVAEQLHEISTPRLTGISVDSIPDQEGLLERLTGRQREVLKLIAEGQNTKQIGSALKLSPKTVEYHRMNVMKRLNVHDIPGLVRLALRAGLISTGS